MKSSNVSVNNPATASSVSCFQIPGLAAGSAGTRIGTSLETAIGTTETGGVGITGEVDGSHSKDGILSLGSTDGCSGG